MTRPAPSQSSLLFIIIYSCCLHYNNLISLPQGAQAFTTRTATTKKSNSVFTTHHPNLVSSSSLLSTSTGTDTDTSSNSIKSEPKTETMTSSSLDIQIPHLSTTTLTKLVDYTISFSAANGLQVQQQKSQSPANNNDNNNKGTSSYITAPISLLPQAYPSTQYQHGIALSAPFNLLVDRISRNPTFLQGALHDVRDVDEFTGKLLQLYEEIYVHDGNDDGRGKFARSADRLGILRSDYMLHSSSSTAEDEKSGYSIQQVELNTIASSFAGLASSVAKLHTFLTRRMGLTIASEWEWSLVWGRRKCNSLQQSTCRRMGKSLQQVGVERDGITIQLSK